MGLDPLQEQIVRAAQSLPEAHSLALAGGGAMLAHGFVSRLTKDIDLFTDRDLPEALAVVRGLRAALSEAGLAVSESPLPPHEHRFVVSDPASGRECAVDVFADGGRLHPRVTLDVGPVLHPDDLAADKVLALWSRALPRDFVDVAALAHRFGPDRLMELAASKDSGFTRETYLEALRAMSRLTRADWAGDGVAPEVETATRKLFDQWRVWLQRTLTEPPGHKPPGANRPGPAPPGLQL